MSKWMYISQAILIAGVLYVLVRRQPVVLRLQVIAWAIGVIGIWWRYGDGQLGFYSNDQIHYASVVRILGYETWPHNPNWWLEFTKLPYPLAALPLDFLGVDAVLALKTVSLIFLLALSSDLLQIYKPKSLKEQAAILYLTGCGLIGTFFSVLALRETMMMFFVTRYIASTSLFSRIGIAAILFLLRSHLAAALLAAEVTHWLWRCLRGRLKVNYFETIFLIVCGVTIGTALFSWRLANLQGLNEVTTIKTPFTSDWGMSEALQIASNFAGLQFLTSHEAFVRLSISELLQLRLLFSETVVVPIGFTITSLILWPRFEKQHSFTLVAFSIYVSIVTNTDFNSFRQNLPFIPMMGVALFDTAIRHRRKLRVVIGSR